MFTSTKLGKLFGIDFYVHATFWILPLFILVEGVVSGNTSQVTLDLAVMFAAFGCVALHEVGHALAARYYGIRTRDITLYPIGGVASLERMPEKPIREIVIALAGPAVNVAIAIGLFAGMLAQNALFSTSWDWSISSILDAFVVRLLFINVVLCLFNLIPAFPMDGGRVLRAVLSLGMPRLRATEIAAGVGTVVAVAFVLIGLYDLQNSLMFVFLGIVVYMLGQAELQMVRRQTARRNWDRFGGYDRQPIYPHDARVPSSGWTWDPLRRVWTEWQGGSPVREVPL